MVDQTVTRYSPPLVIPGGVTSLQSIPYQIGELVRLSGSEGMRIIVSLPYRAKLTSGFARQSFWAV
jgi:hypothetical protein